MHPSGHRNWASSCDANVPVKIRCESHSIHLGDWLRELFISQKSAMQRWEYWGATTVHDKGFRGVEEAARKTAQRANDLVRSFDIWRFARHVDRSPYLSDAPAWSYRDGECLPKSLVASLTHCGTFNYEASLWRIFIFSFWVGSLLYIMRYANFLIVIVAE